MGERIQNEKRKVYIYIYIYISQFEQQVTGSRSPQAPPPYGFVYLVNYQLSKREEGPKQR
jgi:hypothetical protein